MKIKTLPFEDLTFSYFGPDLFWGPMPTVIYFTIDGHSSLCVDPFNQPIVPMQNHSMRVFSVDLPEHGPDLDPLTALSRWALHLKNGNPLLTLFFEKVSRFIHFLHKEGLIDHRLGLMGLSRGAFVAAHVAHLNPLVKHIVGFAPLTDLCFAKEFIDFPESAPIPKPIASLKQALHDRSIKFFIGNDDTRVSTRRCFETLFEIAEEAKLKGIKSAPIEGTLYPSVGHMGHGTPPPIFEEGSLYMVKKLGFLNGL